MPPEPSGAAALTGPVTIGSVTATTRSSEARQWWDSWLRWDEFGRRYAARSKGELRQEGRDKSRAACIGPHGHGNVSNPAATISLKDGQILNHCHACGIPFSEVLALLDLPPWWGTSEQQLEEDANKKGSSGRTGLPYRSRSPTPRPMPPAIDRVQAWAYLKRRGVSKAMAEKAGIDFVPNHPVGNGRKWPSISIPARPGDKDGPRFFKLIEPPEGLGKDRRPTTRWLEKHNASFPPFYHVLTLEGAEVLLLESPLDVMLAAQAGIVAACGCFGAKSLAKDDTVAAIIAQTPNSVTILLDRDAAGDAAALKTLDAFRHHGGAECRLAAFSDATPEGYDFGDLYLSVKGDPGVLQDAVFKDLTREALAIVEGRLAAVRPSVSGTTTTASTGSSDEEERCPRLFTLREVLNDPEWGKAPTFLIPRFVVRGRTHLLYAREKAGKSTLASAAVAAYSAQKDFLGERCGAGIVLWYTLEEHKSDLGQRLQEFSADLDKVRILDGFVDDAEKELLEAIALVDPDIVIVDSLQEFASATGSVREGGSAPQWTPVMSFFKSIARGYKSRERGVVLLHHASKSGGFRDSTAIGAGVDVLLGMSGEDDDGGNSFVRKINVKGRVSGFAGFKVRLDQSAQDYILEAGELPIEVRVVDAVRITPHMGTSRLRAAVGGKGVEVDAVVSRLVGKVVLDIGKDSRHDYILPGHECPECPILI